MVEGGGGLLTCPYLLKVQARPPRDQRLAIQSRVSGQEGFKNPHTVYRAGTNTDFRYSTYYYIFFDKKNNQIQFSI